MKRRLPLYLDKYGVSLRPLLEDQSIEDRALFWHYPHYHGSTWKPGAAIRDGDWKLVQFYHHEKVELYNLKDDIGETKDLSEAQPKKAAALLAKLRAMQEETGSKLPYPKGKLGKLDRGPYTCVD